MGVDYDATFVYGWLLNGNINVVFDKIIEYKISQLTDISKDNELCEKDEILTTYLLDKYGLFLGHANPYFDCETSESVYFLSLAGDYVNKEEMKELLNRELSDELCSFLKHLGLKEDDIEIYCLPHVW